MNKVNLVMIFIIFNVLLLSSEGVGLLEDAEKGDVSAIRLRLEDEKEKRLLLTNDVEVLMLKVAKLERQLVKPSMHAQSDLHGNTSSTPAFMAFMSTRFVCLKDHHVVFDDVRLNVGNYYNRLTGFFQAPVSGTYHFALTLSTDDQSGHFNAFLVSGDGSKVLGYVFQSGTKEIWQSRTVSVLANLESGENVWIKCAFDGKIAGGLHSCFSGFLVDGR